MYSILLLPPNECLYYIGSGELGWAATWHHLTLMFVRSLICMYIIFPRLCSNDEKKRLTLLSHPYMNTNSTLSKVMKWKGENVFRLEVVFSVCHLQYANIVFLANKSSFCSYASIARVGVHNLPFRLKRISCSSCGIIFMSFMCYNSSTNSIG